ncbi:hypothetical protein ACLD02_18015 [Alloalcanivorax sp. C16-2]|uniref:Cap15 family cyclic dinucleotide receptor domain-containing protein n=1 Tax=Alloalcanivorax TaxID=3020832 RepID=UPI0019324F55|nr:hypothetical protein [Alloalcanivorax marinus]MBL7252168.1 hypothetical protein [Alloalcanivorax marinus]
MTIQRLHITAFLAIAAVIWLAVLWLQGTPVSWDHARPFSIVVSGLVAVGLLFEFWLWRNRLFHGWFFARPDLRGTWKVVIQSSYVRPETNERVAPIECYMGVTQTLSKLNMHLMTPESESWLIADHVRPSPSGNGYQIIGVYTNEPNVHLRHERISEMHQGAMIVETHGSSVQPRTLTAKYWTDRKTNGTMEFNNRKPEVYTRFVDADDAFSSE